MKPKPTHLIKTLEHNKSVIAATWCGVDPYRKDIQYQTTRAEVLRSENPCLQCLKIYAKAVHS